MPEGGQPREGDIADVSGSGGVEQSVVDRDAAAAELADRLKSLADRVGASVRAHRISYGRGRLGDYLRRRSPEGFMVASSSRSLQVLLPDGRLWSYSHAEALRFPKGRFYDPRTDHTDYPAAGTFPGSVDFAFLGAVLGKYTFGFVADGGSTAPRGLCALVIEGTSVRYAPPD